MIAAQKLIEDAPDQHSNATDLAQRLETARGVIEAKFLSAGEVLAEAVAPF